MAKLPAGLIRSFQEFRRARPYSGFCRAPETNLNFEQNGNVTACCYNRSHVFGTYPKDSLKEIWFGRAITGLRERLREHDLSLGCKLCEQQVRAGNLRGLHALYYDRVDPHPDRTWPVSMEFEISNVCNLECVMCNGYYSSAIRRNREKQPPMANPYDQAFVEQLDPFLPHLKEAMFLGGEPFMNRLYFQIWDRMAVHKAGTRILITTNGTILSPRVKDVLTRLRPRITVSVDSLDPENYERIRVNADYDRLRQNIEFFAEHGRRVGETLTFSVCPMQQNWRDLPEILRFANEHEIELFFNMVINPAECSLRTLRGPELSAIATYLRSSVTSNLTRVAMQNTQFYLHMVRQLSHWSAEQTDELRDFT